MSETGNAKALTTEEAKKAEADKLAKEKLESEAKIKAEADLKIKLEAEAKVKAEIEVKAKADAELKLKEEAEAKVKSEIEAKDKEDAEAKFKAEAEAKEKEEADKKAEEERLAKEAEQSNVNKPSPVNGRTYEYACVGCKSKLSSLEEFIEHNKSCGSIGFRKNLLIKTKKSLSLKNKINSSPKLAVPNEKELTSTDADKKNTATIGKALDPNKQLR